jgi:hypothetical protein
MAFSLLLFCQSQDICQHLCSFLSPALKAVDFTNTGSGAASAESGAGFQGCLTPARRELACCFVRNLARLSPVRDEDVFFNDAHPDYRVRDHFFERPNHHLQLIRRSVRADVAQCDRAAARPSVQETPYVNLNREPASNKFQTGHVTRLPSKKY